MKYLKLFEQFIDEEDIFSIKDDSIPNNKFISIKKFFYKYDYSDFLNIMKKLLTNKNIDIYTRMGGQHNGIYTFVRDRSIKVNCVDGDYISDSIKLTKKFEKGKREIVFGINKNCGILYDDLIRIREISSNLEIDPFGEEFWIKDEIYNTIETEDI